MALSKRWLNYYFGFASHAANNSYAERDKVGAAAFKRGRIIATGYNGTCSGHSNICEDPLTGETLPVVAHAEINLLGQLAKSTETTEGVAVFVTRRPCIKCAVALLAAGVSEVHCYDRGNREGTSHLRKHALVVVYDPYSLNIISDILKPVDNTQRGQ
jgi:dCMP deaminase